LSESTMALERPHPTGEVGEVQPAAEFVQLRSAQRPGHPTVAVGTSAGRLVPRPCSSRPPSAERSLWPAMLPRSPGRGEPHGEIRMSFRQLAREVDLADARVKHALEHLAAKGRIEVAPAIDSGGEKVAPATGTSGHANGGSVATYGRTDVRTKRTRAARPRQAGRRARARRARGGRRLREDPNCLWP